MVKRTIAPDVDATSTPPADAGESAGLDNLAAEFQSLSVSDVDRMASDAKASADAEATAAAMAKIEAGAAKFIFAGLRALRSQIARRNVFILDEWPDEMLREPADAAVPVLRKRVAALFMVAGAYPEESALAMAALPLILGYVAASESSVKHSALTSPSTPLANEAPGAATFAPSDPRSHPLNA